MPEPRACGEQVFLPGPRSSGPETDTRSILVHFNCCKNWTAPGQGEEPVGEGGSDRVLSFSRAGVIKKCMWHRTGRSTHLSPPELPFQNSGFVLLSCSVWDVGLMVYILSFALLFRSLPNLGDFYSLLKNQKNQISLRHLGKAVLCFARACTPRLELVTCLDSPSGSLVQLLTPVGLLGFQPLAPWLRHCQSHCFLCWSYVVSVPELWVNHEKILTFFCRLMQLFPWRPSKMAEVSSCH